MLDSVWLVVVCRWFQYDYERVVVCWRVKVWPNKRLERTAPGCHAACGETGRRRATLRLRRSATPFGLLADAGSLLWWSRPGWARRA
jgi:hypothetical protein